ncbi:hypothetical protein [Pseudorhodoferax sp.]|uniref:hypothetical protein n=1 Tax=Pseudorhodoferax sp. TaxID=1993553 RepID=UPI002DD65281|nr:hypothetical protein [Pseudorhodoferax sp.]
MDDPSAATVPFEPRPAAETYRDHVIIVLPARDAQGRWRCQCLIESHADADGSWTYEVPGPYADRRSAYEAAIAKGQRAIDRLLSLAGL